MFTFFEFKLQMIIKYMYIIFITFRLIYTRRWRRYLLLKQLNDN
jgi:hypothetical protein